jgi:hypothetical protein
MSHEPAALAEVELRTLKRDVQLFTILNHPDGARLFAQALEKDYSEENILFWRAADMYVLPMPARGIIKQLVTQVSNPARWGASEQRRRGNISSSTISALTNHVGTSQNTRHKS